MNPLVVQTPPACVEKLQSLTATSLPDLLNAVDKITVQHKFKVVKPNGDTKSKYIYLDCQLSTTGRCKPDEQKVRDTSSKKIGSI